MDARPFFQLAVPRATGRRDLPRELVEFYAKNEGIGLESTHERIVRLSRLGEVVRLAWQEIPIFGPEEIPGWQDFEGIYIGVSSFHDGIYRVIQAPCCPPGAILTLGPDIAGPGGNGPETLECCLVLAASFEGWLAHLERYDWFEYGLAPGAIWDLPAADQVELRAYYKSLNPGIDWEVGMPGMETDSDRDG